MMASMPLCVIMTGCIDATTVKPMMETLSQIVIHTPVWVWVLFVFLVSRGIKARQPATVTLEKLAIIPAIFLFWDIYDLVVHRQLTLSTLALWIAGILTGAVLGFVLVKHVSATRAAAPAAFIVRPTIRRCRL